MFHFACGLFVTEDLQHAQINFFHGLSSGIHGVKSFLFLAAYSGNAV